MRDARTRRNAYCMHPRVQLSTSPVSISQDTSPLVLDVEDDDDDDDDDAGGVYSEWRPPLSHMAYTFPIEKPEQRHIIAACIVLSLVPATAVGLRIMARRMAHRILDLSDWLIIGACIFVIGHWIDVLCACMLGGMGYMGLADLTETYGNGPPMVQYKVEFSSIFVVLAAGCFCKISVLALYTRILPFPIVTILARIIAVISLLWYVAIWVSNIFVVQPVAANWDPSIPITFEGDVPALARSIDAMTIMTDVFILALPFPYLVTLRMRFWKKFALLFAFSLGILTAIISVVRLYLNEWDSNITDDLTIAFIFEGLEPTIGVVAACIPTLRPLLGRSTYSTAGTAQPRSTIRRMPMSYDTRVLDDIDKETSSQVQLRPLGADHKINITSGNRQSDQYDSGDIERLLPTEPKPAAIHVRTEWTVSSRSGI